MQRTERESAILIDVQSGEGARQTQRGNAPATILQRKSPCCPAGFPNLANFKLCTESPVLDSHAFPIPLSASCFQCPATTSWTRPIFNL